MPDPTEGSYDWAKAGEAITVAIATAATILFMTSLRFRAGVRDRAQYFPLGGIDV